MTWLKHYYCRISWLGALWFLTSQSQFCKPTHLYFPNSDEDDKDEAAWSRQPLLLTVLKAQLLMATTITRCFHCPVRLKSRIIFHCCWNVNLSNVNVSAHLIHMLCAYLASTMKCYWDRKRKSWQLGYSISLFSAFHLWFYVLYNCVPAYMQTKHKCLI